MSSWWPKRGMDHFRPFAVALEQLGADLGMARLRPRGRPPCRCRAAGRSGGPACRPGRFPRPSCRPERPLRSNAAARSGCSWCGTAAGPADGPVFGCSRWTSAPAPLLRRASGCAAPSRFAFATTNSSIRVGWMRPSAISLFSAMRAISRRTGSKPLTITTPGVSSMITSTPVAFSKARMLRPSRPMMRPFISSLGISTVLVVVSAVCVAA